MAAMPLQPGFFAPGHTPATLMNLRGFPYTLPLRTPGMSDAQYLMHIQKLQHDQWNYLRAGGANAFGPAPYVGYPPAPVMPVVYGAK